LLGLGDLAAVQRELVTDVTVLRTCAVFNITLWLFICVARHFLSLSVSVEVAGFTGAPPPPSALQQHLCMLRASILYLIAVLAAINCCVIAGH
jgi:hypothetical protein